MKTVMKKLLSLMLVAVLLVSAVPFQASADEVEALQVPVYVYINDEAVNTTPKTLVVGVDGVVLDGTTAMGLIRDQEGRTFEKWTNNNGKPVTGNTLTYSWLAEHIDGYFLNIYLTEEKEPVHVHSYTSEVTTAATCTTAGVKTFTCECGDSYTEEIAATGHSWGEWKVTTAATTTSEGVKTRICATCGETETAAIAKLEDTESEKTTTTVSFKAELAGKVYSRELTQYQVVEDLPTAPDVKGYKFVGWYSAANGSGEKLTAGSKWDGEYTTYYAFYKESVDDDISTLSVFVRFYVGGVQSGSTQLLYTQDFSDGDNMLSWLTQNESKTSKAIFALKSSDDYEWTPRYYYEYSGSEPLAEQDLIADGDKSIVVKVYSKKSTEANVLLYIHKNTTSSSPSAIYELNGYTAGDTVTMSAVKTEVKKHYTGSSMTVQGLYTDTTWAQLLNKENPTAANGIKVEDNGTLRIHVLLKNATASDGETADDTNPKTGDMIFVPMILMLASVAAVALVYMGSKKRIVK